EEIEDLVRGKAAIMASTVAKRQPSPFAELGHKALDAMIQAAELVVKEARDNLERVKTEAQRMRDEFDLRDKEIAELEQRVSEFGKAQIEAHTKFKNGNAEPRD